MSLVKITSTDYISNQALSNVVNYCGRDNKCIFWEGLGINTNSTKSIVDSMKIVKRIYNAEDGKQLYHLIINISRNEYEDEDFFNKNHKGLVEKSMGNLIAFDVSNLIYDMGFQNAFFIHDDTAFVHIHMVINSVNYTNGNRLNNVYSFEEYIRKFLKINYYKMKWL